MKNETPPTTWTGGDGSERPTSKVPTLLSLSGTCGQTRVDRPSPPPRPPGRRRSARARPGWVAGTQPVGPAVQDQPAVLDAVRPRLSLGGPEPPRLSPEVPRATSVAADVVASAAHRMTMDRWWASTPTCRWERSPELAPEPEPELAAATAEVALELTRGQLPYTFAITQRIEFSCDTCANVARIIGDRVPLSNAVLTESDVVFS